MRLSVSAADAGARLDRFLAAALANTSRASIMKYLKEGLGLVNGLPAKPGLTLRGGDVVELPGFGERLKEIKRGVARGVPAVPRVRRAPAGITVIYEDDHLLVIDKPSGVVMHPGKGHREEGLDRILARSFGKATRLVHRLDRDTSGVLVAARGHPESARRLTEAFREGDVRKSYLALVTGSPEPARGTIDLPLHDTQLVASKVRVDPAGRRAVTDYETLESWHGYSWLRLNPRTGRKHQIRVHLAAIGHPLAVDRIYGRRRKLKLHDMRPDLELTWKDPMVLARTPLHAESITLRHPGTGQEMTFTAPLPADLAGVLEILRG
ncbi:MAG: RluA family pseudouridine synthase [Planctomycetaceae bacterium]